MSSPSFSLVMLWLIDSANQAAPSGATASRPRRTIGVSSGKLDTSPEGVMRDTTLGGDVGVPGAAVGSHGDADRLNVLARFRQALQLPVAHPANGVGAADREPDRAVPAAAMPIGMSCGSGIGYSTNCGRDPRPQTR